jgi:hypothetical protein
VNQYQAIYAIALLALSIPAWGRQRYALVCLVGNLVAMLAVCLAMDMGLDKDTSRLSMMIVDLATGVALAMRPGLARVIAAGYAVTVLLYVPVIDGVFTLGEAGFAVIYAVSTAQIVVLGLGTFGGFGGGGSRRRFANPVSMAIPQRGAAMAGGPISSNHCNGQE